MTPEPAVPAPARQRPRALDLYCGEGGAGWGYHLAGFEVVGVDLNRGKPRKRPYPAPLRRYPFSSIAADALVTVASLLAGEAVLGFTLDDFDLIHASPPCQLYSPINRINTLAPKQQARLIEPTRELLLETGLPYVIENVPEAPLLQPVLLCGSMFDPPLDVQRHRAFEANWELPPPVWPCRHKLWAARFRGADYRGRRNGRLAKVVPVYGGTRYAGDHALRRAAMEIDWMTGEGLVEAIPPRYTEFIGLQLMELLTAKAAA